MKNLNLILLASVLSVSAVLLFKSRAAEPTTFQVVEFATIRWQGRDNSQVIRPNGKPEKLKPLFERAPRPNGLDERAYYLTIAINALAKEGYDFAGMTSDEIVMRRPLQR